jgi:2-polyprenyl-6-methoxyphenol hydroxylase-like FAD-dependent oxidoreductase
MLTIATPAQEDDASPETRRCYFIWYVPTETDAARRDLFTDEAGRNHGLSIPPPAIRREVIAAFKARARSRFAPAVAEVVERTRLPMLQAISDFETSRMVFGRVVLLGDCAFVARPHVAGGITKAALDADALASALAAAGDDTAAVLAGYEASRLDFGTKLVAHARALGSYIDGGPGQAGPRPDPRWIMREYGAPHLLRDPDLSR